MLLFQKYSIFDRQHIFAGKRVKYVLMVGLHILSGDDIEPKNGEKRLKTKTTYLKKRVNFAI